MESKKLRFLNKLSFVILFATVFGSILFFIPYIPVSLNASKGFLLAVGVTLSLFFWLIARLGEGKFHVPKDRLILFAGIIPFVFLIASFFSSSLYVSLFGQGFETGTFGSMLVLFILFFLSSMYFQTEKRLWYFFGGLFGAALLAALFELINLFVGFGRFPGLLSGLSAGNLVGSWNDFALFFGLIALLCIFTLEFINTKKILTGLQYFLLIVSIFFMIILNVQLVWILVGAFSLIFSVYAISLKHTSVSVASNEGEKKKFPFSSLVVFFVCLAFLLGSNSIGALISRYISVANTDVRPSVTATAHVAYKALHHNPVFGTGPNTFSNDWALWRPEGVAQTAYWDVDFENGVGLIPTFLATTGILGFAAFLLFLIVFLMRGIQSLRVAMKSPLSNYFIVSTFMISLYAWLSVTFYTPNIIMLMIAFASSGVLISILLHKKAMQTIEFSFLDDPRSSFFAILGLIILMIGAISMTYIYAEKFASVIYYSKSLNASNTMDSLSHSERMLNDALMLDKNDVYYRTLSQVYIAEIGVIINDTSISQDRVKSSVQQLVNAASQSANLAVSKNPNQYLNEINLGNVYSAMVPLSVADSYQNAVTAYNKASVLAPNNPSILLDRASLEFANKTDDQAKSFIKQALAIKPDYTDAMFLLAQIDTNEGDVADAISEAQYASQVAPNDPTVFFRLGLLEYSNSNYTEAVSALETAVVLDPQYLDARYYLALSYKKVGRTADAATQLKILNTLAPGNQDIQDQINGTTASASSSDVSSPATTSTTTGTGGAVTSKKSTTTSTTKSKQ
jgi:cytochrome c-type biogenesis protein CcmH/NrfG